MPKGNNDRGRTFRGGRYRGRGANGHGPNRGNGRGRGRGITFMEDPLDFPVQMWPDNSIYTHNRGGFRGRGRGNGSSSQPNSGSGTPGRGDSPSGRGRGRGGDSQYHSPRRRGAAAGRGSKLRHDAPLSKLLYEERPFLKPIIFVPSVYTRTLFEQEEDLLQPQVEDIADEDKSHVPTADRVTRIFSGGNHPPQGDSTSDDEVEEGEEIQEIDFEDMARIREEVDVTSTSNAVEAVAESRLVEPKIVEERFTGVLAERTLLQPTDGPTTMPTQDNKLAEEMEFYADSKLASDPRFPQDGDASVAHAESTGFFVDTTPATTYTSPQPIIIDRMAADQLLGESDEEIIVYVAPHPRVAKAPTPLEPISSLPSTSILTGTTSTFASSLDAITAPLEHQFINDHNEAATPTIPQAPSFDSISFSFANKGSPKTPSKKQQPRTRPVFTAGERSKSKAKARKKEIRATRRRLERRAMFGSFGAIMSEAQLRGDHEQVGKRKDPRWEERRRGDSDIDWGDSDEGDDASRVSRAAKVLNGVDEVSNGMGAMELDSDVDVEAMKAFVKGMSVNGGRHVTMDDIADEEQMRLEDVSSGFHRGSESGASDSDGEIEKEGSVIEEEDEVIKGEEEMMMGVPRDMSPCDSDDDKDDEDDLSDGIDQSPNSEFQAKLQRLREMNQGKKAKDAYLGSEEDTSDDDFFDGYTRAEEDDDFIAHVEALLDEKGGSVLSSTEREARKRLFQAVQNGEFSDPEQEIGLAKHKKGMNVPAELHAQWARDRAKKAENKQARNKARIEAAADPMLPKKGGKKGHKAILAAAKFDSSSSIPERVIDMVTLEQQVRRFLADIGGKTTMSLPPMNKESRKQVHELAIAFNLKSQSKGKGNGRYTTLTKTTRSGIAIDERKVRRVVKHSNVFTQPGAKGKNAIIMPRHRDGDEVGKAAPKIGEANIGFKMLASMGWSEGDRIGISGGLVAPLTAVIKNTKLGLGANR